MSEEMKSPDERRSPDELRLPDQLAACEARLAALPLAASRLNRDEVLYRAGWAAAEAKLSVVVAPRVQRESGSRRVAAWSLTSAALAASLAVAATLAIVEHDAPRIAVEAGGSRPPLATAATTSDKASLVAPASAPRDERGELALANVESMLRWNTAAPSASLLAAIRRPLSQQWDQPIFVSAETRPSKEPRSAPATVRALLDELLPANPENSDASPTPGRPSPLGEDTI